MNICWGELIKEQRRKPSPQAPIVGYYVWIVSFQQVDKKESKLIAILKR
jgi:hypothetical protein